MCLFLSVTCVPDRHDHVNTLPQVRLEDASPQLFSCFFQLLHFNNSPTCSLYGHKLAKTFMPRYQDRRSFCCFRISLKLHVGYNLEKYLIFYRYFQVFFSFSSFNVQILRNITMPSYKKEIEKMRRLKFRT